MAKVNHIISNCFQTTKLF